MPWLLTLGPSSSHIPSYLVFWSIPRLAPHSSLAVSLLSLRLLGGLNGSLSKMLMSPFTNVPCLGPLTWHHMKLSLTVLLILAPKLSPFLVQYLMLVTGSMLFPPLPLAFISLIANFLCVLSIGLVSRSSMRGHIAPSAILMLISLVTIMWDVGVMVTEFFAMTPSAISGSVCRISAAEGGPIFDSESPKSPS